MSFAESSQLREIGERAFYKTSITEVQIPASVQSIGWAAFVNCYSLSSIVFAEGSQLKEIGEWAFYDCENLKSITIPKAAEIDPKAFKSSVIITRK